MITWYRTRVRAVNVLVAFPRDEEADTGADDDVVSQQRAPLQADTAIPANVVAGVIREKYLFSYFCRHSPDVVGIHKSF